MACASRRIGKGEPMNKMMNTRKIRTGLLATASSVALLGYVCAAGESLAASGDDVQPMLWVEFGGQAERASDTPELFAPPRLFNLAPPSVLSVLTRSQEFPPFTTGFEGKISFQPEDSDWILSAGIRYGRSGSTRHLHHQTAGLGPVPFTFEGKYKYLTPYKVVYADVHSATRESHAILDFQAGKDLGLGLFGTHGESIVSAGVRFAQFTADSHATIHARPIYSLGAHMGIPGFVISAPTFHQANYTGIVHSARNTRAIGPSLSWNASLPVAGDISDMTLNVDWGVNGAVLFGRQRASVHHQTKGYYRKGFANATPKYSHGYTNLPTSHTRSRNVAIRNAAAFVGLSLRSPHAKLSLGYRADFFFGALDGGIDTRKSENREFYGPFASISVGLGD
ncbi:MAG TPA: hypothetical protein VGT78_02855 [Rhizomicrobium sp.]|nr:hypothetical protein [Rhizomicrobium sp.]